MSAISSFAGASGNPDPGASASIAAAVDQERQLRDQDTDVVAEAEQDAPTSEEFADSTSARADSRPPAPEQDPYGRGSEVDVYA